MEDQKQPLLKHPDPEEDCSAPVTRTYHYQSLNSSGPQLSFSPPRYDAADIPNFSNIQVKDEEGPPTPEAEIKVYKRRWYILMIYGLIAATQGGVWNMYGPISATLEDAFGWHDSTIALLSNWGPIAYLLSGLLFSWLLDVKGIRSACLLTALVVTIGTAVKCITFQTPFVTWLTHVGQFFNGLGGPVAMAAPPILSATWFPPDERTTATAIGTILNYLGVALSFIMGPFLVPDVGLPSKNATNGSSFFSNLDSSLHKFDNVTSGGSVVYLNRNETVGQRIQREKNSIALYTYIGAGWCGALLLLVLLYFPNKPALPPCPSAALQRDDFTKGLKHVLTRQQFWLVTIVYGTSLGTVNSWSSVLDVILKPYGISQDEAGWIGFYATCSACAASLIVARFADFFKRIMKWLVLCAYVVGTSAFVVFALTTVNIIPAYKAVFYCTVIVGITSLNAAVPLIYELSCELAYPTGEGTTNMILTIVNNVFGLIFLFIMMIPGIGTTWTIWMVVGTSGACIPLLFLMKEQYNRLAIDEHHPSLNAQVDFPSPQQ